MARDREFMLRDDVLFDRHNVQDTAAHCWARNAVLKGRAATVDTAAEKLIAEVLQEIKQGAVVSGKLFPVYNAWCVVDAVTPGATGMIGGVPLPEAQWNAAFFVRLGRQPVVRAVSSD